MIETMEPQNGRFRKDDDSYENYAVTDGFHTTTTELNALAEGNSFVSGYIFEAVNTNASVVVHLKSGSKKCIMNYGVGSDGSCDFAVYKDAVITSNGTLFGNVFRNWAVPKESTAKTYHTPTTTSNGVTGVPRINGGSSGPAKGGSTGSDAKLVILPPDTSLLIIATNKSATASRINIVVDWIELE